MKVLGVVVGREERNEERWGREVELRKIDALFPRLETSIREQIFCLLQRPKKHRLGRNERLIDHGEKERA